MSALTVERSTLVLPVVVLSEVAFLLEKRHVRRGQRRSWAASSTAPGRSPALEPVDAAIAALAERLASVRVYTLDHRDFTVTRPRHAPAFEMLAASLKPRSDQTVEWLNFCHQVVDVPPLGGRVRLSISWT